MFGFKRENSWYIRFIPKKLMIGFKCRKLSVCLVLNPGNRGYVRIQTYGGVDMIGVKPPRFRSRPKLSYNQTMQTEMTSDQTFQTEVTSDQTFQTKMISDQTFQTKMPSDQTEPRPLSRL